MRSSITRLHSAIDELTGFLQFAKNLEVWRAGSRPPDGDRAKSREIATFVASSTWRRQTYSFAIVGIYGAHERFVSELVEAAAGMLANIHDTYSDLPEKVRQQHERLSLERAMDILDRKAGKQEDLRQHLSDLHACLNGSTAINREVFSFSTSNFRSETIKTVVSRLGVELPDADKDPALAEILNTSLNGIYGTIASVIDDLANRRNEVAHGSDFSILDIDTLSSVLYAVYAYDCWLCRSIASSLLKLLVFRGTDLAQITKTFTPEGSSVRSIASIETVKETIRRGDTIYVLSGGAIERARVTTIQRLHVNVDLAQVGDGPYGFDLGIPVKIRGILRRIPPRYASVENALTVAMSENPRSGGLAPQQMSSATPRVPVLASLAPSSTTTAPNRGGSGESAPEPDQSANTTLAPAPAQQADGADRPQSPQ